MGRMVDLDELSEYITDAAGVAGIIGIGRGSNVSLYRKRHPEFPEPVIDMGSGRCKLWERAAVEAWVERRRAR